jgi:hypothetical protein
MGVLAEITERVLRTAEGVFGINHPWGTEQGTEPSGEGLRILQHREGSVETEFVLRMQRSETFHELASEHFFEHIYWQEELLLRVDPPRVGSQTAGGNYTMHVGMRLEFLVPGVEDAEEPDLGAETLGIAGDLDQCLGAGPGFAWTKFFPDRGDN